MTLCCRLRQWYRVTIFRKSTLNASVNSYNAALCHFPFRGRKSVQSEGGTIFIALLDAGGKNHVILSEKTFRWYHSCNRVHHRYLTKNVISLSMFRLQLQAARSVTTQSPQPQKFIFNYLNTIRVIVTVSDQNKGKVSESCFFIRSHLLSDCVRVKNGIIFSWGIFASN